MRPVLSIVTLLRSPIKTFLSLLLLVAVSFAFVGRGAEYAATSGEINRAESSNYRTVGYIRATTKQLFSALDGYFGDGFSNQNSSYSDGVPRESVPITPEAVELAAGSRYIDTVDLRRVSGGTNESLRAVTEQPVRHFLLGDISAARAWGTPGLTTSFAEVTCVEKDENRMKLYIDKVIVGDPAQFAEGNSIVVQNDHGKYVDEYFGGAEPGGRYFAAIARTDTGYIFNTYVPDVFAAISEGGEYALSPETEYSVRTLQTNLHSFDVVYTSSMDTMDKVRTGLMYAAEGTLIDGGSSGDVCVISADMAEVNGLAVGDTVELTLTPGTYESAGRVYGRASAYPTGTGMGVPGRNEMAEPDVAPVTKTFEIVGIWSDSDYDLENPLTYSLNTVFVPYEAYPWQDGVEPEYCPSTFGFSLKSPEDIDAFRAEVESEINELGYELVIRDGGYEQAKSSFDSMKQSALIGFIAMSAALLLALLLTTYLFVIRKKYDYAIMRALGTPVPRANASLLVGLFALALAAVLLGTALAVAATSGFAADLSAQIGEVTGGEVAATLPGWTFGAFGAGTLALLLAFAWAGLVRIGRIPPLRLLQGK